MNIFAINGNLTRDPELQYGQSGKAWMVFSVAYNHNKDEVSYFDCKVWGQQAEFIAEHFGQGDGINLTGDVKQERWEDKGGGGNRSKVVLCVRHATFPKGKKGGGQSNDGGGQRQDRQPARGQQTSRGGSRGDGYGDGGGGGFPPSDDSLGIDDIPFSPCRV